MPRQVVLVHFRKNLNQSTTASDAPTTAILPAAAPADGGEWDDVPPAEEVLRILTLKSKLFNFVKIFIIWFCQIWIDLVVGFPTTPKSLNLDKSWSTKSKIQILYSYIASFSGSRSPRSFQPRSKLYHLCFFWTNLGTRNSVQFWTH